MSVDPLAPDYVQYTPYQFAGNRVINSIDLDGLEDFISIHGEVVNGPCMDPKLRPANAATAFGLTRSVEDILPKKPIPRPTIHIKVPKSSQSVVYEPRTRGANFANPMTAGVADGLVIGLTPIVEEVGSPVLDAYEVYNGDYSALVWALVPYDRIVRKVVKSVRKIPLDAGANMAGRATDEFTGYWAKQRNNPAFATINLSTGQKRN